MSGTGQPRLKRSGTGRLWLVMCLCVVLSVGGVMYAVVFGDACDGGRGGALAVALTFAMLFLDRRTPTAYLEMALPAAVDAPTNDPLKSYLGELKTAANQTRNAVAAVLDWAARQRWPLAISSVVGTVFWGFGDVFAGWFGAAPC